MGIGNIEQQIHFLRLDQNGRARLGALSLTTDSVVDFKEPLLLEVSRTLQGFRATSPSADSLADRLELDLQYLLVRHAFWLNTNIFYDALADRIARGYLWPRQASEDLARQAIARGRLALASLLARIRTDDREFLRFVVVSSALAADDAALQKEIGLGAGFLGRIKQALLAGKDQGDATCTYVAGLDADLCDAIEGVAATLRAESVRLESWRIHFQLSCLGESWRDYCTLAASEQIFLLLCDIGKRGTAKISEIIDRLGEQGLSGDNLAFAKFMSRLGLVDCEMGSKGHDLLCRLSPFSLNLTAENVVSSLVERVDGKALLGIHACYQVAAIKRFGEQDSALVDELINHDIAYLAPDAQVALLLKASTILPKDAWQGSIRKLLSGSSGQFAAKAARSALRTGFAGNEAEHTSVVELANGNSSDIPPLGFERR